MKYLIVILLSILTSCALFEPIPEPKPEPVKAEFEYRYVRYQKCVVTLHREGIRQGLLLPLCDAIEGKNK